MLETIAMRRKGVGVRVVVGLLRMLVVCWVAVSGCATSDPANGNRALLLEPSLLEMNRRAPDHFKARLETSKGDIVIEVHRDWAPHGVDRFYNLVRAGYYDGARFYRVIEGRWAQFGINGDPKIAKLWRTRFMPDDPARESNVRGTVAF